MRSLPFPSWPVFDNDCTAAVTRVLQSGRTNYWTGEEGRQFEAEFAAFVGARYGVAMANGTLALELSLRALGLGPGDDVIVTPRSFIASASSVNWVGANPVFADVDRNSGNLTAQTIEAALTPATRAILLVHLAGWPCDMHPILRLAKERNLFIIEDASQAHGARYHGESVGHFGDLGVFSFCQDKILSTGGEGAMVVTSNQSLWEKIWSLKDHGKTWDSVYGRNHPPGYQWLHDGFGTNARLTEMQSALGRVVLTRLPTWLTARRQNVEKIGATLESFDSVRLPKAPRGFEPAFYRLYAYVRQERLAPTWTPLKVREAITAEGIPCQAGTCGEIYRERAFLERQPNPIRLPVARELAETGLMLTVHPALNPSDINDTCLALHKVLVRATMKN